jgi:hypothetical protein
MVRFSVFAFLLLAFVVALSPCLIAGVGEHHAMCEEGVYSKEASIVRLDGTTAMATEFPSPDGMKKIIVKKRPESSPQVFVRIAGNEYMMEFSPWPCPEFQWAQDSEAFFVTYSDGGAVGNYIVLVCYPSKEGVKILNPTSAVEKDFLHHYPKCFTPETPNLGGVSWIKDSRHLLVAAEVLPHSNCDMMGTFSLYEIEVPSGKIIGKYDQLEAKKLFWKILGVELRNANDECFTEPGACSIPMLHEK